MTDLILHRESCQAIALPEPRVGGPISIRPAIIEGADLKFIDELQKKHNKMVGFLPRQVFEKRIAAGEVLIAEDASGATRERIGYCMFGDKYLKREELGIVYQLNVTPGKQRGLVGAALVRAAFDRCPYGVKLFCCWCAQDIEANHFWESIGFIPIAFRAGSRGKAQGGRRNDQRIHIFWQRRIREGDTETPYWFPSETTGGALKENRIVLPIPPGTHWSDAKPAILPGMENVNQTAALPGAGQDAPKQRKPRTGGAKPKIPQANPNSIARGRLRFVPGTTPPPAAVEPKEPKPKREKQKNDPKYVAAARELRDRYLEEVNSSMLLPPSACGKYDVSRQLEVGGAPFGGAIGGAMPLKPIGLLDAA